MKKIRLSVLIIMIGTMISKILGLLRDVILASGFGASVVSDAYIISTSIPSLLVGAVATAIMSTYIPVLNSALKESDEAAADFNNNAVGLSTIIVTIFLLIFFMFPDFIVSLFVLGFDNSNLELVINMTRITIYMSYFLVLISIFSSYLQNNGKFKATSFNGLIFNSISIIGILLSAKYNVMIMAYTFVIGYFIATLQLYYQAYKNGLRIKLKFNYKNKYIKKFIMLTIPVILNSMVWDINVVIDKTLTSTVGTGYVSGLNYSFKLINVANDIIAVSIATFIFPRISKLYHKDKISDLFNTLFHSINLITILLIPISVGFIFFAESIVQILFMRGNFDEFALSITATSLRLYSLTLLTSGLNVIIYKYYNSVEENRIPAINAMISIIFNIVMNLIFIKPFGYKGIIFSTVLSTLFANVIITLRLRKRGEYEHFALWLKCFIRSFFATIIAILFAYYIYQFSFIDNVLINLMCTAVIYIFCYIILLFIEGFRIRDILF